MKSHPCPYNRNPRRHGVATESPILTNLFCTMQHYKIFKLHAILNVDVVRKERTIAVLRYPLRTAVSRVAVSYFCFLLFWPAWSSVVLVFFFGKWGRGGISYTGGPQIFVQAFSKLLWPQSPGSILYLRYVPPQASSPAVHHARESRAITLGWCARLHAFDAPLLANPTTSLKQSITVTSANTIARAPRRQRRTAACSLSSWTTANDCHAVRVLFTNLVTPHLLLLQPNMTITGFISEHFWTVLVFAALHHIATTCIYRRYFHPLAKIPGPFLPAVTKLYQSYFNCRYYLEIERLHQKYGPVVRITPDEVHIASNSEDYEKIYHVGSKYAKSSNFYNALCVPHSSVGTESNEVHKIKRGAMNPIFARQKVLDVESIVQDKVAKVIARLENSINSTRVGDESGVDLHHAFRAVSVDVASEFSFGTCYNFLDKNDTGAKFFEMARGIGPALYAFQQLPSLQRLALKIPPWLAPLLSRPLGYVTSMQAECIRQIDVVKEKMSQGHDTGRSTIFTSLLSEDEKPEGFKVPTTLELKDEAYSVLVAAADTTGNAMTVAAFNAIYNPEIYRKLATELEDRFPDRTSQLPFVELERLPYLVSSLVAVCNRKQKLTLPT